MFLLNNWYVAAFADDVKSTPVAKMICGQAVVLYRTAAGHAVALEDRCAHRGMPLSHGGECEGENIRCAYHGLEFGPSGVCVKIPGQDNVPRSARVRAYPLVERDAMLWIWPGDTEQADTTQIISHPYHSGSDWTWSRDTIEVDASANLIADNLMDASHLQYVHRKTIGGNPEEDAQAVLNSQRVGNCVEMTRWLMNLDAPAFHRKVCGFQGKVDRWQDTTYLPGLIRIYSGAKDAGTGAYEGNRAGGMELRHLHALTPKTENTATYSFSQARNFKVEDEGLTANIHKMMVATFMEDKVILEAQSIRLAQNPDRELVAIRSDTGVMQANRLLQELIAAQNLARSGRTSSIPAQAQA